MKIDFAYHMTVSVLYFHINREDSNISYKDAMISASGIVLLNAVQTWCGNRFLKQSFHNGMKVRVAVCSVIYRKVIRILIDLCFTLIKISNLFHLLQ